MLIRQKNIDTGAVTSAGILDATIAEADLDATLAAKVNDTLAVGTTAGTVAAGDHGHTGTYEPADADIQSHLSSTGNPARKARTKAEAEHQEAHRVGRAGVEREVG